MRTPTRPARAAVTSQAVARLHAEHRQRAGAGAVLLPEPAAQNVLHLPQVLQLPVRWRLRLGAPVPRGGLRWRALQLRAGGGHGAGAAAGSEARAAAGSWQRAASGWLGGAGRSARLFSRRRCGDSAPSCLVTAAGVRAPGVPVGAQRRWFPWARAPGNVAER